MSKPSEFRGFNVARRGYDRRQVDHYLRALSEADSPVAQLPFEIVRRGYDCQEVDARIRDLLADKGTGG
ncbi:hypothetical protein [Streptomyces sp. NPDC093097]|uniref:hypothetical protein n=1 Tax=Streptomyces sp. NPDC093097 TaxID=3366027 RepID=UPI00380C32D3